MDEIKLQQIVDQSIKEAHLIGLQAGKQETSGLVDLVIHKMETKIDETISKGIEKHVNGKIKAIDAKLDAYIKDDNEWKDRYSPYLEGIVGVSVGGKIMVKFILGIATVGAAILAIKKWFL